MSNHGNKQYGRPADKNAGEGRAQQVHQAAQASLVERPESREADEGRAFLFK